MDLERMLRMCRAGQWKVGDLDWSQAPRPMSADDEIAVVQYFTDMSQIERLAGALFLEQERRVKDPTLKEIFRTFVDDEIRHAHAAQMLADHYDVHRYRVYRQSPSLARFFPVFVDAVRQLDDDVANTYITCGELILDIALLRSLNDYVDDPLSSQAMELINRDESRHIAVDYHMAEYYASSEYRAARAAPDKTLRERARSLKTFAAMTMWGRPCFRDVFFGPMDRVDPTGKRLREAFKRMQLLGSKPGVDELPLARFMKALMDLYHRPWVGPKAGALLARIAGVEPRFMEHLCTDEELERAKAMSFEQLAEDALAQKNAD